MTPTSEQQAILTAATQRTESLLISAYAGCSKTTVLEMIAQALPIAPGLALAFNVTTKKELEKRFPKHFEVMTLNGLGHRAWARAIGRYCSVDEKKLGKLVSSQSKLQGFSLSSEEWIGVKGMVTGAMKIGLVPSTFPHKGLATDDDRTWRDLAYDNNIPEEQGFLLLARDILIASIKEGFTGNISFDDQIYLSALFNGVFPRFPLVLVDESQDLSPLNHLQVKKCAAGRLVVVGDALQSIYAFRGADHESISKLKALRNDWIELPLTTTFRCPKVVVQRNQTHAPGFQAFSTNASGEFIRLAAKTTESDGWGWKQIEEKLKPNDTIAILCRNNAPLLSLAFKLIRQQVPCTMAGRNIGKGLLFLAKKILPDDDLSPEDCATLIKSWLQREISLARANGKEERIPNDTDRAESLLAILDGSGAKDARALRKATQDLFAKENGRVLLSTIHRAKGLEWSVVVHLDPWRIPSRFALKNPAQLKQEKNLLYVCETRTKRVLINANLEDFQ